MIFTVLLFISPMPSVLLILHGSVYTFWQGRALLWLLNTSQQKGARSMELFGALVFFAFATSITPGPNNIMIMSSGVNYGVQKSLPHLAGVQIGFLLMLLAIGLGAGLILQQQPILHQLIKLIGSVYLLYLAWKIASAEPVQINTGNSKPLSLKAITEPGDVVTIESLSAKLEYLKFISNISTAALPQPAVAKLMQTGQYERHLRQVRPQYQIALQTLAQLCHRQS